MTPSLPLRERAKQAHDSLCSSGWDFAIAVAEIAQNRTYLEWGFRSLKEWAAAETPRFAKNISHYCVIGTFLLKQPPEARGQWMRYPVWVVLGGQKLLSSQPEALLATLEKGASQSDVRRLAATALPDEHVESEWRTISLRVSLPVYEHWQRAWHRAVYEACAEAPTTDEIVDCLATAMTNETLFIPDNGITAPDWRDFVESGQVQCRNCGSKNRTQLDWHHVVARSAGGSEGVQVPLCRRCHTDIQPRWREWAAEQDLV